MIGNPTSLAGTFYDSFHKNRNQWKTIHISAFETPNFKTPQPSTRDRDAAELANDHHETPYIPGLATPVWADEVRQQHGERSSAYQVRVLGDFPDEADDTLIPLKLIEAAVNREIQQNEHHEPDMGLDVARFGNDQTVAIVRYGPRVAQLSAFRKADLMQTTGRALEIARSHNVKNIHVDEVGIGRRRRRPHRRTQQKQGDYRHLQHRRQRRQKSRQPRTMLQPQNPDVRRTQTTILRRRNQHPR